MFSPLYDIAGEQQKDFALFKAKHVSREFLLRVLEVPPEAIWFPEVTELERVGVITDIVYEVPALADAAR